MDFLKECREYTGSFWECPQVIFLIIGFVIIFSSLFLYFVGQRIIQDPLVLSVIITSLTVFLLVLDYVLVRSFEKLVQANRFKAQLTSFVVHQLRSPLSNISLLLERAQSTGFQDPSLLELVFKNISEARELLNDLSLVGKLERKKISFNLQKISLRDFLRELLKTYQLKANSLGQDLELEEKEDLQGVVDPHYFSEVLRILIENALTYSKGKGKKVRVVLRKERGKAVIEVIDQGIGIDPQEQKYIFQEFFRGEKAQKLNPKGTGLGLYLAKSLIEGMGGKLSFSSFPDKGSTFRITLPLK